MAQLKKLGRPTDERLAVLRSQATALLWYGKVETTLEKAKASKIGENFRNKKVWM